MIVRSRVNEEKVLGSHLSFLCTDYSQTKNQLFLQVRCIIVNMCSRFYIQRSTDLIPFIEKAESSSLNSNMSIALSRPLRKEGEIRPTDMVPVIAPSKTGKETAFPMVWGFTNTRSTAPIINARVETVADKPMFQESWEHRRCAIPCS